jgi:hypothetical protein
MSGKKTLYHSELVKMGFVSARINSEPIKSQYPDKPKYVIVEIAGEERYLNCENEECEFALTGLKDEWVELDAQGSREDASIIVERVEKPHPSDAKKAINEAREKIRNLPDEKPRPKSGQRDLLDADPHGQHGEVDGPPVDAGEDEKGKLRSYAAHSGKIFALAWEESKNAMALIPEKDATELSVYEWLDLRLRITNNFCIVINKIIRKERF